MAMVADDDPDIQAYALYAYLSLLLEELVGRGLIGSQRCRATLVPVTGRRPPRTPTRCGRHAAGARSCWCTGWPRTPGCGTASPRRLRRGRPPVVAVDQRGHGRSDKPDDG